jgi:soluble lytic murein transglycosylase-like protein
MVGTGGTGFLDGFTKTALALQQLQQTKDQQDQALAVQKENLALQRDILKGQESSRKLQDAVHLETLTRLSEEAKRRAAAILALQQQAGPPAPAASPPPAEAAPITQTTLTPSAAAPAAPDTMAGTPGVTPQVALYQRIVASQGQNLGLHPDVVRTFQAMLPVENASGDPTATSPKGALGPAQLMPATAARYQVDPANPVQNLSGGVRYFNDLWQMFPGHPEHAIAAYNAGEGAVQKAGGIPNFPETQAYVKKVLGNLQAQPTPDTSQQMAGPGAPTPVPPPTASSASAPSSPAPPPQGQGERLSDQQIALAVATNPQRRELAQKTQELQQLEAFRTAYQKDNAAKGTTDQAVYKEKIAEYDKAIAEKTARRTQLEGLLQPKTPEEYWILSNRGALPIDLQYAGTDIGAQAHAAYERQSVTTKKQADDDFERTQPILKVDPKHDYVDLATGEKVPATMPYGQALDLITAGKVKVYEPLDGDRAKTWSYGTRATQANTLLNTLEADGDTNQRLLPHLAQELPKFAAAGGTVLGTVVGLGVGALTGGVGLASTGVAATAGGGLGYGFGVVLADPLANALRTPREQQYVQAQMEFLTGILRKDSQGTITAQEYRDYGKTYFPQPGNGPAVIAQKAAARAQALKGLAVEAGRPLGTPQPVALAPKPPPAAPSTSGFLPGEYTPPAPAPALVDGGQVLWGDLVPGAPSTP